MTNATTISSAGQENPTPQLHIPQIRAGFGSELGDQSVINKHLKQTREFITNNTY